MDYKGIYNFVTQTRIYADINADTRGWIRTFLPYSLCRHRVRTISYARYARCAIQKIRTHPNDPNKSSGWIQKSIAQKNKRTPQRIVSEGSSGEKQVNCFACEPRDGLRDAALGSRDALPWFRSTSLLVVCVTGWIFTLTSTTRYFAGFPAYS